MLLYTIEESFGNFIKENITDINQVPEGLLEIVGSRTVVVKTRKPEEIENILEATYLDEVFQLALAVTKGTSFEKVVLEIRKLAQLYNLYEIRNAVSHPNRPFIDCYWYKLAAFACEPIIQVLGLTDIMTCIISAEKGIIQEPPEEWFQKDIFEIKNNLPLEFDHEITGLIGRDIESNKLLQLFRNPRVNTIGVIAPGGLGKTALVLDLLYQQMKIPSTANYADAIIFVSMKIEKLTVEGIEKISASETIDELKNEIVSAAQDTYEIPFEDFNECKDYLGDQKVLICIDNLETLLRDEPEAFDALNLEFPVNWRVIVTSRTLINANQIIQLEPLKEKPSEHLIRSYLSKKGVARIPTQEIADIAKHCYCNPLAIRLTLDRIIAGESMIKAIEISKSDIAEFSFRNLLESLSENSILVLEALFVCGPSSRAFLCDLLKISQDDLIESLTKLLRTSLLHRKIGEGVEKVELSSSVKDLLLVNKSSFPIREKIVELKGLKATKAKEIDVWQKELSISKFHRHYIPPGTDENLKILLNEFHRCSRGNIGQYISILKKFEIYSDNYNDNPLYQRIFALLYLELKDFKSAMEHSEYSVKLDPKDPVNNYVLAECNFYYKNYKRSAEIYGCLVDDGWSKKEKSDRKFALSLLYGLFNSLLFSGNHDELLERTNDWESHKDFKGVMGGYRATTYKRIVENSLEINPEKYTEFLGKALDILDKIFSDEGYAKSACSISWKIIDEIERGCARKLCIGEDIVYIKHCSSFLNSHLVNILQQNPDKSSIAKRVIMSFRDMDFSDNHFRDEKWIPYITEDQAIGLDVSEISEIGYTLVSVYHIPHTNSPTPNWVFAKDDEGNQYYLHKEKCSTSAYELWDNIIPNTKLAILPGIKQGDKSTPAEDIIWVNSAGK